jgi:isocitrate dehydrogenase (NAD+)
MATNSDRLIPATLIPGDGIGPEITEAVVAILDALGAPFEWDRQAGGMAGVDSGGDPLPAALLDSISRTKLALKGPLTTPVGGGFRSVNVRLREAFNLYANMRPVRSMVPGGRYENIDIVLSGKILRGFMSRLSIIFRSVTIRRRWQFRRGLIPEPSASA